MARTKGSFGLAGAIEPKAAAPLDARDTVKTKEELTASGSFPYSYIGMETFVVSEKKKYRLVGTDPTVLANWEEIGAGGSSGGEATVLTGTLTVSGWSNKSQTVTITGMTASTNGVIGLLNTATDAQIAAAATAKIKPTAQGTNSVTFTCEAVPAVDIPFGVVIGGGSSALVIDSVIDSLSENAVQNKVIAEELDKKYSEDDAAFTALADDDYIPVYDTSASTKKKTLWSNIKTLLGNVFQAKLTAGTGISLSGSTISVNGALSGINYSTSEQSTGLKWIDNKAIYQKTINFGALPNATTKYVDHGISSFKTLVDLRAIALWTGGGLNIPFPPSSTDFKEEIDVYIDAGYVAIHTKQDRSSLTAYVTIFYTKS